MKPKQPSKTFLYYVRKGKRKTTNKELALRVAQEQGKRGIDYIPDDLRATYLKAYPELGFKFKASRDAE